MNVWELGAAVLGMAILPCVAVCVLATASEALVALELAGMLTTSALMLLAEGFHRQPFIDLAIVLGLLSLIGSLAFARLMEAEL
jgi:multisubunit Na+/H+ antiporter MnhF subunit